jgi:dihydrofolate synthase/folylpolyglutamate synthase
MTLEKPDFNSFESTIKSLFSRVRGHIEPGAHRMQALLGNRLLNQLEKIPTILVGGTNGKGTTCAVLEKTFRSINYKTALYTSPHLVSPTERIRINGIPVSQEEFLEYSRRVYESARHQLPDATFFELMTGIALEIFARSEPEVLVCEVGLGGRLDSTNVLAPNVSVITSIGLDHTEWLGSTETQIGFEKGFISRRNRPLVLGHVSPEALSGIQQALRITGGRIVTPDSILSVHQAEISDHSVALAAEAAHQLCASGQLQISNKDIFEAAQNFHWPGRFDLRKVKGIPVLLDAAHNPHGVEFFLRECDSRPALSALPRPQMIVFASLADKDWRRCLQMLSPRANTLILTQTQSQRAVPTDALINYIDSQGYTANCIGFDRSSEALDHALQLAAANMGSVMILGSLTLIGEAMEHLRLPVFSEFESGASCVGIP